jgi:hypothetical protein
MTMKPLRAALMLIVLPLLLTGCESVPFINAKDQIESLVTVYAAGAYKVSFEKDGKVIYTETWDCTATDGKMTGCHKRLPTAPVSSVK